ncbi:MAG: sigma-70 family RNA polymerase sigma factor [Candidatus Pseudobacter hemicellulosilyticus]|uniref:Sigma-70 family RNA polymerase sigma factor n=1 Tax=Candidatus Pseudobacter hemicellulosilyticus TaxID=3121375 RepID=A0AAJ5WMW1_9BACT|nr:MAG: sigma-70 family RNA polymerase sigma factor [Pseudobacter sp.]
MSEPNLHTTLREQAILERVAAGEEQAFAELVSHYTPVIYRYLLHWLKQIPLAEEAAQDIFMRIWRNREKLPGMANFRGYLYVVARNQASTLLQQQLLAGGRPTADRLDELLVQPHYSLELKELAKLLERAVAALPPRRKEIFTLSRREGLTYEEIARRLAISRHTVKEHMVAALLFLRQYIQEYGGNLLSVGIGSLLMMDWLS